MKGYEEYNDVMLQLIPVTKPLVSTYAMKPDSDDEEDHYIEEVIALALVERRYVNRDKEDNFRFIRFLDRMTIEAELVPEDDSFIGLANNKEEALKWYKEDIKRHNENSKG